MEDLLAEIMGALSEKLNAVSEVLDLDAIMDSASDAVHSLVNAISDHGADLDGTMRNSLIERLTEAISGDPSDIIENLAAITDNPLEFVPDSSDFCTSDVNFSAESVGEVSDTGKQISFGSAGCWDECFATTKDHGKRLTCGYQY